MATELTATEPGAPGGALESSASRSLRDRSSAFAVAFFSMSGQSLEIALDALHLRLVALAPAKSFRLCS